MADEDEPLRGFTVGVTAERKARELGEALARRGARVRYGAAMHTVPVPEDGEVAAATARVLDGPVDFAVVVTGAGFRGWLEAAEHNGVRDRLVEHLSAASLLARGAKAQGAIRGAGLRESWVAPTEEVADVRDHLLGHDLSGRRIALQLHGDPMEALRAELSAAGAEVVAVPVYRWTDPVELGPLDQLIDAIIAGEVDALPLTSAPAAANLLGRADRTGRGQQLRESLGRGVLIACVGPVTAAPIAAAGLPHVMPERSRTRALVKLVSEQLPAFRA